jgi:hypothetical protein
MPRACVFSTGRGCYGHGWFEGHSAFRAWPWMVLLHFRIHRADVRSGLYCRCFGVPHCQTRVAANARGRQGRCSNRCCRACSAQLYDLPLDRHAYRCLCVQIGFRFSAKLFSATLTTEIICVTSVLGFRRRSLRIDRHTANWVAFHASPCPLKRNSRIYDEFAAHVRFDVSSTNLCMPH